MIKPILLAAMLATTAPAAAFYDFYQTEGSSNIDGTSHSPFAFAPATYRLPGVTISNVGYPTPTVRIDAANHCCGETGGIGQWGYNFTVAGPDNAVVPLLAHVVAHGVAAATTNGSAIASAQLDIFADSEPSNKISVTGVSEVNRQGADAPAFSIDQVIAFDETANDDGYIQGYAAAVVDTYQYYNDGSHLIRGTGSASVYLDPFISIDPVWSAAHPGYSIVVDSGFGNSPVGGVPEPASWALLVAGFGVVGTLARRRRAVVAA